MIIGSLYFLGRYRPLHVEGDTVEEVFIELFCRALDGPPEALERLLDLRMSYNARYTRQSIERGTYGASMLEADAHPLPPALWADMPPCPGLIYN